MPKPTSVTLATERQAVTHPTHGEIEQRAYQLYVKRGDLAGSDVADWLQAEGELLEESQRVAKAAAA